MFSFSSPLGMSHTANSFFSTYASLAGTIMLLRSMANDLIPPQLMSYLIDIFNYFFPSSSSNQLTVVIQSDFGMERNEIFEAAEIYLNSKISPDIERLKISKNEDQKSLALSIEKGQEITDSFEKIRLKWKLDEAKSGSDREPKPYFELSFNKKFKDTITESYLPHVMDRAEAIKAEGKVVKLFTSEYLGWKSIHLKHPSTFDTLALDPHTKNMIVDDLDRFLKRKEFYNRVGKPWKRGYLLYGPPGTGKSSLIAAIANYLNFDIYDLQLSGVPGDSFLKTIFTRMSNRSILVIEDIDCNSQVLDRENEHAQPSPSELTLSGILNFVDGLWSSCGDERIIIFTTNHKERLDPALLRTGRMDVHINMSYCSVQAFKILLSNYLGSLALIHPLYVEMEELIASLEITPADIAENLLKEDDIDLVMEGLLKFLKEKKVESMRPKKVIEKKDAEKKDADCDDHNDTESDAKFDDEKEEINETAQI